MQPPELGLGTEEFRREQLGERHKHENTDDADERADQQTHRAAEPFDSNEVHIQRAVRCQEPRLLDALEIGVFSKLASRERKSLRNQMTRRVPSLALELHPIAAFRAQQEVLPEQRDQRDEKDREPGHRAV